MTHGTGGLPPIIVIFSLLSIETLPPEEGLTSHLPEVLRTGQIDLSQFGINPKEENDLKSIKGFV
ncbi:hypothetical protein NC651_036447 [Populus alba x Populus x berolinensis]|nr:hypothetical protein NC651_036447 [Populus alba x Populus x berolinensis]